MDLLIYLFVFVTGFILFLSVIYFLAKWMFPKLIKDEEGEYHGARKRNSDPLISRKKPYSF